VKVIFGSTTKEITTSIGEKLHNKELHNFYSSPNAIWAMKWRTMRWVENEERLRQMRNESER
jgi:hypothetical protein